MKLYVIHIIFLLCLTPWLYSQEDGVVAFDLPVRNSLKFNRYAINPTFSFVREENKYLSFTNKREWVQFDNAPQTYLFSYSGRFRENIGVGLGFFQQNYGVLTTFGGIANFAYNVNLNRDSNLTFGMNVGFYKSGINEGNVITNFPDSSLDNIPSNSVITVNPGINYGTAFFDFGVSINNLATYNLTTSEIIEENPEQSIQGHIMYTGYINNRGFFDESKFSTLILSEFKREKTVLSGIMMLTVPKGIWAQVGYNTLYGVSGGIGLNITNQIALEYNYEKSIGDFSTFGNSHEITLAYKFKNKDRYNYNGDDDESALLISTKRKPSTKNRNRNKTNTKANKRNKVASNTSKEDDTLEQENKLKQEAEEQAKVEEEAKLKLAEENRLKQEAEAQAKLVEEQQAIAKAEEEAKLKLAEENRLKQEAEARAKQLEEQQAKAKAEEEAKLKLAEENRLKQEAEAQAKLIEEQQTKAKAEEEAKLKLEEENRPREEEIIKQQDLDAVMIIKQAKDREALAMQSLTKLSDDSKIKQQRLLISLNDKVAVKQQDLDDLKEENDLSEKGIYKAPKAFKSVSSENVAIQTLQLELDNLIDSQELKISELENLYSERIKNIKDETDPVNEFYLNKIKEFKAQQSETILIKDNLKNSLESIKEATEVERKRRIKRAAYDNQEVRYLKDRSTLKQIKESTEVTSEVLKEEDFDFGEEQSNIQIVSDVQNTESGYYLVIAVHTDVEKRDEFLRKAVKSGRSDIDFFFDVNTSKYYIYYNKFDDIDSAKNAIDSKTNAAYNSKMSMVKIVNE
ncbi:PorP/SprF family type IX secretion system membrane protein [Psychroserpens sp.]|uniref:PorP/SprF family type IX secretion system membrane protein n=1 Tax=Psychroserpens sp. TaxID=2020870 RepID=UPI00385FE8AB